MGRDIQADRCIKTEGVYGKAGIYVVVVVSGGCPVEVQASLSQRAPMEIAEVAKVERSLCSLVGLCNDILQAGGPVSALIKFMRRPPCGISGIIAAALVAALEA